MTHCICLLNAAHSLIQLQSMLGQVPVCWTDVVVETVFWRVMTSTSRTITTSNTCVHCPLSVASVSGSGCSSRCSAGHAHVRVNHSHITRLSSWFGIHGSVLSWFKSYLSSRSFRVKCDNNLSSFHTSSCGVPKVSVLSPLLFDECDTSGLWRPRDVIWSEEVRCSSKMKPRFRAFAHRTQKPTCQNTQLFT